MTITRRALFTLVPLILATLFACSPASNQNTTTSNANAAKPAANTNTASAANANAVKSKPGTGSIEVTSMPAGAGITLASSAEDSAGTPLSYGATPTTISDLAPGKYAIQVSKPGYKTFTKEIEVKAGATARITATLKK
jgi:PEGA domain